MDLRVSALASAVALEKVSQCPQKSRAGIQSFQNINISSVKTHSAKNVDRVSISRKQILHFFVLFAGTCFPGTYDGNMPHKNTPHVIYANQELACTTHMFILNTFMILSVLDFFEL